MISPSPTCQAEKCQQTSARDRRSSFRRKRPRHQCHGWCFNLIRHFYLVAKQCGREIQEDFLRVSEIGLIGTQGCVYPWRPNAGDASANVCMTERFVYQTAKFFIAPFVQLCVAGLWWQLRSIRLTGRLRII